MNEKIIPKGLAGYLEVDPTLKEKRTIDQLENPNVGIDDSILVEAYNEYKRVIRESKDNPEDKPYTLNKKKLNRNL